MSNTEQRGPMLTAKEREEAFRKDLAELLSKHDAELEVTDDRKPYGLHNGVCRITMWAKYDHTNGNETHEFTEFNL